MARPPKFSSDEKLRIVLSVVRGESTIKETARRAGVSEISIAEVDRFLDVYNTRRPHGAVDFYLPIDRYLRPSVLKRRARDLNRFLRRPPMNRHPGLPHPYPSLQRRTARAEYTAESSRCAKAGEVASVEAAEPEAKG